MQYFVLIFPFIFFFRSDLEMQGILNSFGGQECYKILKNVLPVPSEALLVKHSLSRHFFSS